MPAVELPARQADATAFTAAEFTTPAPAPEAPQKEPLQMMSAPMKKPEEAKPSRSTSPKGAFDPNQLGARHPSSQPTRFVLEAPTHHSFHGESAVAEQCDTMNSQNPNLTRISKANSSPSPNQALGTVDVLGPLLLQVKVEKKEGAAAAAVIMEGDAHEEDEMIVMVDHHGDAPAAQVVMDPNEKHGKLVDDILKEKAKLEQGAEDEDGKADEAGADSGIILGRKASKSANAVKLPSKNEINSLRQTIQTLCQASNPLGRCLEYVQEDLDSMGKELETWRQLRRRRTNALAEEEATTASSLLNLNTELGKMEELIKDKQSRIRHAKASIIRNDSTIEQLLSNVVRT
ncbi:MAG: hypothetical protein SGPRY_004233 [Prymnesium sp.]